MPGSDKGSKEPKVEAPVTLKETPPVVTEIPRQDVKRLLNGETVEIGGLLVRSV